MSHPAALLSPAWLALAGYLVVALVLLWPLPLELTTHMLGDPSGDPLLNAFILGWDADRLRHGLQGLWQAPLFYPAPDTLAWSEHLLGIAMFVAPIYWITANPVLVYNVALLASIVLAGMGMHLLARELTGRTDAAWIAGLLYSCLPYRVAQLPHLQVLYAGWMPLALLGLHRYFRTGSKRALAGLVAAYALTSLSNGYYLFFLAVPVAIVAGWHLAARIRQGRGFREATGHLALAALAIVVSLAPVIRVYLRVHEARGFSRTVDEMAHYSATMASYGSVAPSVRVWKGVLPLGRVERELFPGLTLGLLAAVGLAAGRRHPAAQIYTAVALTAFVLTLGPRPDFLFGPFPTGPYDWLLLLPGLNGLRVPARVAMVGYLGLCVMAAVGMASITCRSSRRLSVAVLVLASVAAVAEGLPAVRDERFPSDRMSDDRVAYEWLASQPRGPMLELPVGGTGESTRYLVGTLTHGNRIVNGYSGYKWGLEDLFGGPVSLELGNAWELLRAARAVGLRYVVVHRALYSDQGFAADLAYALEQNQGHVAATRHFGNVTVLVLRAAVAQSSTRLLDPQLSLAGCDTTASHNQDSAYRAVDGNVGTRWLTGVPQRGGEWLEIRCRDTRVLTSLELLVDGRSYTGYPRRLAIDVSTDGVTFQPVWEGGVLAELAVSVAGSDRPGTIHLDLPAAAFRAVRLRQTGKTPRFWYWSVDELVRRGR